MILFPAIDILNGRAVRLLYGKIQLVTDYGDPLDRAKQWIDCGAEWLHVVDLGGAFKGEAKVDDLIYSIAKLGVPVQSGGGLRTREEVVRRLECGAERVIIGTMCHSDPDLFFSLVADYGEKIVAGLDAKDGFLSVCGWTKKSDIKAVDFGKKAKAAGVGYCVYTDVSRDGAMTGVAKDSTVEMQLKTGLNVIASGGISSLEDLLALKESDVYGAILGRSIYVGAIDLKMAIAECK